VHPSDAVLLALLHGELAPSEAVEVQVHLTDCADCSAVAVELERADLEIGALLGVLDHPMRRPRPPAAASRSQTLRRAAIATAAALFAAVAAAAAVPGTAFHQWIQTRLQAPRPALRQAATPPVTQILPDEQAAGGIEVPAPRALTITFTRPQPGAVLTVSVADRPVVTLRSFGGSVAYQVGDEKIVVDNRQPARRYTLEVPAGLRRLTVMLQDRVLYRSDEPQPATTRADTISLSKDSTE
jgi:anti-sigma factor RsiW